MTPRPGTLLRRPLVFLRDYFRAVQRYLITGLLVWIPLIVTIWISWWMITVLGASMNAGIEWVVTYVKTTSARIPMLTFVAEFEYKPWVGFLLAVLVFLTTGLLTRYLVTQRIIAAVEQILTKLPLFNKIYVSSQQIRDVFTNRSGGIVQEVVLFEYPRKGIWSIGFTTSKEQGLVQAAVGHHMQAVFQPTTPNPTSGYLLYVRSDEIIPLNISVEDAMKMVISGGAYIPDRAALPAKATPEPPREGAD
jgi:uncharacterized membrane protein